MALEKEIIAYRIEKFDDRQGPPTVPSDAVFMAVTASSYHTNGTKFHGMDPLPCYVYHYQIPIYKKTRTIKNQ